MLSFVRANAIGRSQPCVTESSVRIFVSRSWTLSPNRSTTPRMLVLGARIGVTTQPYHRVKAIRVIEAFIL